MARLSIHILVAGVGLDEIKIESRITTGTSETRSFYANYSRPSLVEMVIVLDRRRRE